MPNFPMSAEEWCENRQLTSKNFEEADDDSVLSEVQLSKEEWRDLKEWYEKRSPYMTTESFLLELADRLGIAIIINRSKD